MDDFTEDLLERVILRHESRPDWFSLHQRFLRKLVIKYQDRISPELTQYFEANRFLSTNFRDRNDAKDFAISLQTALEKSKNKCAGDFQRLVYRMIFNCPPEDGDFGFLIYDSTALALSAGISETEVRVCLNDIFV